eukprot:132310-Amphidinium_carterae.1
MGQVIGHPQVGVGHARRMKQADKGLGPLSPLQELNMAADHAKSGFGEEAPDIEEAPVAAMLTRNKFRFQSHAPHEGYA